MSNLIADGTFKHLSLGYQVLHSAGAYVSHPPDPNQAWWVGPGVGGTVGVSGFPYQDGNILNLEWSTPPSLPGVDPAVDGQETILEYHSVGQALATSGKTLRLTFQAIVGAGQLTLVPIVWINCRQGIYWVELGAPEVVTYKTPNQFVTVERTFVMPSLGSRLLDSSEYIGAGLNYPTQVGGQVPFQLLLYGFSLEVI